MRESARWVTRTTAVIAIALASGVTAHAAPPAGSTPRSVAVRTADLDLSEHEGIRTLYRRIQRAALEVCDGGVTELYLQKERTSGTGCYRLTIALTVERANLPMLASEHRRNGRG